MIMKIFFLQSNAVNADLYKAAELKLSASAIKH